ncbi:MAG: methyltransferase domain-containing protein [Phycisphaerae bacterium]|nr:methyltransferase domain-containing protein [Phycisphaerae bacterium]
MSTNPDPFDDLAAEYDAWFDSDDGRIIFAQEVACLRELMGPTTGRWLEVSVGTGRFAVALGVGEGVDPAGSMRVLAEQPGVRTTDGVGERLPYPVRSFDGVLMTTTLCFLTDPAQALHECRRVLKDAGRLVVGLIPVNSTWGRLYASKAAEGHRIYSAATFRASDEVISLATDADFDFQEACSCLPTPPDALGRAEQAQDGIVQEAEFVAMAFATSRTARQHP